MLEAVLRDRGFRVAKYTSPHLVSFRERMVVDGAPVDESFVVSFVERWIPEIERIGATFFEATTAMAFQWFAESDPDIAIVEVGLGGRLDATNVIDPILVAITSIGLDHAEYLGSTIEAIAAEKAGVFKRSRPAVIGEPGEPVWTRLAAAARTAGAAPISVVALETPLSGIEVTERGTSFLLNVAGHETEFRTSLIGAHQARNAATALRALELLPEPWRTAPPDAAAGLGRVALPGRFQRHGKYILDVAHNADGMSVLTRTLAAIAPPRPLAAVFSVLADKAWGPMLDLLAPVADRIVLTIAPSSPVERGWDPSAALEIAAERGWPCVAEADFGAALETAEREGATVVITGSFHTVGDAMSRLHVSPLAG
jgi:dihydrofolate synthase/folylpolyglutamate synthase